MRKGSLILAAIFLFGILSFLIFDLVSDIDDIGETQLNPNEQMSVEKIDSCSGLNLEETSECLRLELIEFYNYNISNAQLYWNVGLPNPEKWDDEEWDRIKTEGAVCWHYAEWYIMRAKELGFEGKRVRVEFDPLDHAVAMLTDLDNTYCVLDQTKLIGCGKVGGLDLYE